MLYVILNIWVCLPLHLQVKCMEFQDRQTIGLKSKLRPRLNATQAAFCAPWVSELAGFSIFFLILWRNMMNFIWTSTVNSKIVCVWCYQLWDMFFHCFQGIKSQRICCYLGWWRLWWWCWRRTLDWTTNSPLFMWTVSTLRQYHYCSREWNSSLRHMELSRRSPGGNDEMKGKNIIGCTGEIMNGHIMVINQWVFLHMSTGCTAQWMWIWKGNLPEVKEDGSVVSWGHKDMGGRQVGCGTRLQQGPKNHNAMFQKPIRADLTS